MTTIAQERAALAKVPGASAMRRREQWGARFNYTTSRPVDDPATRVFVHITVTEPSRYSSNDAHARAVENIGISRFPATGISYNRLVMPNAALYEGQPMGRRGAHTVNDFKRSNCTTTGCPGRGSSLTAPSWNLNVNARSYVICQNVGHVVTDAMVETLARAIAADKLAGLVTKNAAIHGHRCVSSKDCPGGRMWARMGELNQKVNRYVANGLPGSGGTTPTPPQEDDVSYDKWTASAKKALLDDVAKAVRDAPLTSRVSGNASTLGNQVAWSHQRANDAATRALAMTNPITSPVSGNQRTPRQMLADISGNAHKGARAEELLVGVIAALDGLDTNAIVARMDQHHSENLARLESLSDQLEAAAVERDAIAGLVAQVGSGDLAADRAIELVQERLDAASAALGGEPDGS